MFTSNDSAHAEYVALMSRSRSLERTMYLTWTLSTTTAAALLAWAVNAGSPGPLLGAVVAVAVGFYPMLHTRQQMKLIACYVEEFVENRSTGPQWHTRIGHLQAVPIVNPSNEWVLTAVSNLVVLVAIAFSWVFAGSVTRGELIAGIATACGVTFALHSVMETSRVERTDFAAVWRKVSTGTKSSVAA